jgi:5-methylthioribose kinase
MECAPVGSENWKQRLLSGRVDAGFSERVGDFLGRVHMLTRSNAAIQSRFRDQSRFDELRLDAYLRFTARKHPELAPFFDDEVRQLSRARICLVHGDYSPKNVLILPSGGFWVLDWEVAHIGHPAFDCAFCLNHLLIKAQFLPEHREELLEAARAFWAAYRSQSALVTFPHLGRMIGMLMLARVDGKSPLEYVTDDPLKQKLRSIAGKLIQDPPEDLKSLLTAPNGFDEKR